MRLRNLLSKLGCLRSQQECTEQTGLVLSERLKDLLASQAEKLNSSPDPVIGPCADVDESVEIEANDSEPHPVKTAA